jgi:predicted Zn-dependent protease
MRIAVVTVAQGDTARAVASRMAMPLPLETFRVINRLGAGDRLEPAAR